VTKIRRGKSAEKRRWLRAAAISIIGVAVLIASSWLPASVWLRSALAFVDRLGAWGPIALGLLYVLATVMLVPGFILTLGAGALFGVFTGTLTVSTAATAGATSAFLIARYAARNAVARRIAGNRRFESIDRAVAVNGWKIVLLTRLSPVFPFNVLNYAFGLTNVSLRDYVIASWIGMLPATVMYVYIGSLAASIARIGAEDRVRSRAEWIFYFAGLAAAILTTVYVTRIARRALKETGAGNTEA
jgi:uncharacterized membrane protein YdjX (TVP38/TMEM64 family)